LISKYASEIGGGAVCPDISITSIPEWRALHVLDGGVRSGVFVFLQDGTGVEVHTLLDLRGRKAITAMLEAQFWVWQNTLATHISSFVFTDRPATWFFARSTGFKKTGSGFSHGDRELDRVIINRAKETTCHS